MSTQDIYQAVYKQIATSNKNKTSEKLKLLDIGAGRGELIQLLSENLEIDAQACDYHIDRFALEGVPILQVNLNQTGLPYEDQQFDIITCSEVIEHLENYRALIRETYRVLKPGGLLVLTTPNVLNLKSRVRYFISGFANLFGPLPIKNEKLYSTGGHITPIPYFYLAHALLDADFGNIRLCIDKKQKSSTTLCFLFYPFIWLGFRLFLRKEKKKYETLNAINIEYTLQHNRFPTLAGRTIIVSALKD